MKFKEMTIEQLEARKADIAAEVENEDADLNALEEEARAINAELEARKAAAAQRAEIRKAVAHGTGTVVEKFEEKKEERKMYDISSKEYRNAWLADKMGREISAEERTAISAASAVIPTITLNEIEAKVENNDILRRVNLMNIPGYVKIPVEDTINDASWTTTATDSADTLGYVSLAAYQLIKTVEVSADVAKMSIDAFEAYLVDQLARKIESALQKAVLVGGGSTSSQPTGIYTTVSTATGVFTKAAVTKKDLLGIMAALGSQYHENACWIMPAKVFYGEVMALSNSDSFANINNGFGMVLFGKPVLLNENTIISSNDTILFGDLRHYRMNLGEGITVDRDASVGFRSNSTVYRAVCQADGKLDLADSFVRYDRSAT